MDDLTMGPPPMGGMPPAGGPVSPAGGPPPPPPRPPMGGPVEEAHEKIMAALARIEERLAAIAAKAGV